MIISTQNRQRYIEALVQGQQLHQWHDFCDLIVEATTTSLIEILSVLATAADLTRKELPFFQNMLDFLRRQGEG